MATTACPVCGGSETAISEIDQSICCGNCGTVLKKNDLVQYHEQFQEGPSERIRRSNTQERDTQLKLWWYQVASFYNMGEDLKLEGVRLIDRYYNSLPFQNLYFKEICVGLASSIGKAMKPFWTSSDFIEAFPLKLTSSVVVRSYRVFEGENVEPYRWVEFPEKAIQSTLEPVYNLVVKQIYGKRNIPDAFNLLELVSMTKKLFELGTFQGINAGRKTKPLIVAVACICALQLSLVVDKGDQVVAQKRRKIKPKKHVNPRYKSQEELMKHHWDFDKLSNVIFSTAKTIRSSYKEYILLLLACAKKIPWIPQEKINDKNVYTYLDDILELYSQKMEKYPLLSLSLDEFAPLSFRESRVKEVAIQDIIECAKKYNEENENLDVEDEDEEDEEKRALVYDVFYSLNAGYTEKEIASWSVREIHNRGELIRFREKFSSQSNADLNRVNIGQDDMNEEELESYTVTTLP